MSLLMDALRKAEQEKKAAAERLREKEQSITGEGNTASSQSGLTLSLADDDEDDKKEAAVQGSAEDDTPNPEDQYNPGEDPDATLAEPVENLALRSVKEDVSEIPEEQAEGSAAVTEDISSADEGSNELSLTDNSDDTASGHGEKFTIDMSDEAGAETLGADSGKEHVDDTLVVERESHQPSRYEESPTLSETLEQTRTYSERPEREATREYAAADTSSYTPVSAQTVFAARKSSSYATITVGILVMLVAVGLAAYGVFYYFSVTPINRDLPSPAVARGVESTEALPIVSESPTVQTGTKADDIAPPELPADTPVVEMTADTVDAPAPETPPASAEQEGLSANASSDDMVALPRAGRPSEPVKPATGAVAGNGTEQPAAVAEELELRPELLQISRSTEPAQESQALIDAYQAFRRGDLATARSLYSSVHENEPENLDALLGLAAIAVRNQNYRQAYEHYSSVLRLNPGNADARAALINLQQQADPAVSESRIKAMLRERPESGYLHYALGNVYSRQQRWPDAQQAYFNAHSHDNENADYALNLAISLDHMNKRDTAVDYYNKALELAKDGNAGFDADVIRQRISELGN